MNAITNYYTGSREAPVTWTVTGFREKTFQACPGEPVRPAGCCDKCGASIRYVVSVKSSDGRVMDVGTDCAVTLEGGIKLADIRAAERAWERAQYLASPEYAREQQARRSREAERQARADHAEDDFALMLHGLRTIADAETSSTYERDRAIRYRDAILIGERDTDPDEQDARILGIAYVKATPPASRHVGTVGEKIERVAMLEAMIPVHTAYGLSYVQKYRSADGETLVWFSRAGELGPDDRGSWVRIRGTVKAHKAYQGEAQTTLTRCKIAK